MAAANTDANDKLTRIFFPYAHSKLEAIKDRKGQLAHYTTAANGLSIIRSKRLWMRNARVMSDFSEIQYGYELVRSCLHKNDNSARSRLFSAFAHVSETVAREAVELFDGWWNHINAGTFVSCLSEHRVDEDKTGRLSMWRAFGKGVPGIAVVMKIPGDYSANALNVTLSPVAYSTQEQFDEYFATVIENIEANVQFLKSLDHTIVRSLIFRMLLYQVASLKHRGFEEELEWRLLYLPAIYPSGHMERAVEVIHGVPQIVHKIPLRNDAQAKISGIEIPEMFDRIIIGPVDNSYTIYEAFVEELTKNGVMDAADKVMMSNIPFRD